MANKVKIPAGEYLLREGDHSTSMYWVQKGQFEVSKKKGNIKVVLGHVNSGELIGEISFLDKESRSASVRALVDSELVEIPQDALDTVFKSQPKWLEILVKTMAERLRKANARIKI